MWTPPGTRLPMRPGFSPTIRADRPLLPVAASLEHPAARARSCSHPVPPHACSLPMLCMRHDGYGWTRKLAQQHAHGRRNTLHPAPTPLSACTNLCRLHAHLHVLLSRPARPRRSPSASTCTPSSRAHLALTTQPAFHDHTQRPSSCQTAACIPSKCATPQPRQSLRPHPGRLRSGFHHRPQCSTRRHRPPPPSPTDPARTFTYQLLNKMDALLASVT